MSDPSSSSTGAQSSDAYNSAALESINSKLLGDGSSGTWSFPSVTLAGGQKIRTGTVATLLYNMRAYDAAAASGGRVEELRSLEDEMRLALPTLDAVGMFELFAPDEWIASNGKAASPARKRVGELAKEMGFGEK